MFGGRVALIALLASPGLVLREGDLFATLFGRTRRVRKALRLDKNDSGSHVEVVRLLAFAGEFELGLRDRAELVGTERRVRLGASSGRERGEARRLSLCVEPAPRQRAPSMARATHQPRSACASGMSGFAAMVDCPPMLRVLPPKSPTLAPLNA